MLCCKLLLCGTHNIPKQATIFTCRERASALGFTHRKVLMLGSTGDTWVLLSPRKGCHAHFRLLQTGLRAWTCPVFGVSSAHLRCPLPPLNSSGF